MPLIYLFGTGENQNWNDPDYDWSDYPKWKNISELCYGIGPSKRLIVTNKYVQNFKNETGDSVTVTPYDDNAIFRGNEINFMSNLIPIAHSHGLKVTRIFAYK